MSAFEAYQEYVALKNHFNKPNYDYVKYNGKTGLNQSSFNKRKDKIFFEKLSRKDDFHEFLLANLSINPKLWIRDLAYTESADKVYSDWKKRQQSLSYIFKQDLNKLDDEFDNNFVCKNNEHPLLLKLYLANEISLETLCILLDMTNAMKHWDSKLEYDPVYDSYRMKIVKYTPFIKYDKDKMKKIVLDKFND